MEQIQDYVAELDRLIEAMQQERARISVLGRALTDEEHRQLGAIEAALPPLAQARALVVAGKPDESSSAAAADEEGCQTLLGQTVVFTLGPSQGVQLTRESRSPEESGFRVWRLLEGGSIEYHGLNTGSGPLILFPPFLPARSTVFVQGLFPDGGSGGAWTVVAGRCQDDGALVRCDFDGGLAVTGERGPLEALSPSSAG